MSIFDSILKGIGGAPDDVTNLATKLGIDPAMAEKAIAALGKAHQAPGDTVETASAATGLPTDTLNQIVAAIGGEGTKPLIYAIQEALEQMARPEEEDEPEAADGEDA